MGTIIHFIWDIIGWLFFGGIGIFFMTLSFAALKDLIERKIKC